MENEVKRSMCFDDNDIVIPVTQKYKITDKVKLNGIEYEVFNIVEGKDFTQYQCTRLMSITEE